MDSGEVIKFTVADAGVTTDDPTLACLPNLAQPLTKMMDGKPFEHVLTACSCEGRIRSDGFKKYF